MKKKTRFTGFTLIETIITVIIMAILIGVVFETYVVIGRIAVFIQRQKGIHNEIIYLTQVIQNMVDDQDTVLVTPEFALITPTNGFRQQLNLQDDEFDYTFSKMCTDGETGCYINLYTAPAGLEIIGPGDIITNTPLTNSASVEINQFVVKLIPFEEETTFSGTMHDGFWMFIDVQSPAYSQENRWNRVSYKGQLFFNPRKY